MTDIEHKNLDLKGLIDFARDFAIGLNAGDCVCLNGDLGAGKTELSRAIIRHLSIPDAEVPSPTFTLVQTYTTKGPEIWHFDLYRLKSDEELEEIGWFEDIENRITLVEWPDRLGRHLPKAAITLDISINDDETRSITVTKGATA